MSLSFLRLSALAKGRVAPEIWEAGWPYHLRLNAPPSWLGTSARPRCLPIWHKQLHNTFKFGKAIVSMKHQDKTKATPKPYLSTEQAKNIFQKSKVKIQQQQPKKDQTLFWLMCRTASPPPTSCCTLYLFLPPCR